MKNEFIPTNFEIVSLEKDTPQYPTLIKVYMASVVNNSECDFTLELYRLVLK